MNKVEKAMAELNEKIQLTKKNGSWDGVDVDAYMDKVRGREDGKEEGERIGRDMGEKLGKQLGEIIVRGLKDEYKKGYEDGFKDAIKRIRAKFDRQQFIPESIQKVIDDHFWEML